MKTGKVLFVICSSVAHGAEQVLMDTLDDFKMAGRFEVLGPDIHEIQMGFVNRGVNYHSSPWLRAVGAGKTKKIGKAFKKLVFCLRASIEIFRVARNYDTIIGNNTGDCLWAPATRLAGKSFYLWVHDDQFYQGLIRALNWTRGLVNGYIACSRSVELKLHEVLGPQVNIECIFNGLSDISWTPKSQGRTLKLGWIGAMENRKDPLLFLDIIQSLCSLNIPVQGRMVFKSLDCDLEQKAIKLVEALKIPVTLIGQIPRGEIHRFLCEIDILVVTSLSDPLPTVVIEAYRAGTPVLVRDIPSLRDMVVEGKTGFIFSSKIDVTTNPVWQLHSLLEYSIAARDLFEASYRIELKREKLIKFLGIG